MSQWIELSTPHGTVRAWEQLPLGTPRGALVIIQEIYGVNPHVRAICTRASMGGYAVLAPSFFDLVTEPGLELDYCPQSTQRGKALVDELGLERAVDVVDSAAQYLRKYGKVGTSGYCWGGTVALLAAQRLGLPSASYYGARNAPFLDAPFKAPASSTSACSMPPSRPRSLHCTVKSSRRCLYMCTRPTTPSTARWAATTTPPAPTWRGNAPWLSSARN